MVSRLKSVVPADLLTLIMAVVLIALAAWLNLR
jgi:hypothetical protein